MCDVYGEVCISQKNIYKCVKHGFGAANLVSLKEVQLQIEFPIANSLG